MMESTGLLIDQTILPCVQELMRELAASRQHWEGENTSLRSDISDLENQICDLQSQHDGEFAKQVGACMSHDQSVPVDRACKAQVQACDMERGGRRESERTGQTNAGIIDFSYLSAALR
jgi:hypothetical protein